MSKKEPSRYTLELREEAVKLVIDQGFSVSEATLRLNIPNQANKSDCKNNDGDFFEQSDAYLCFCFIRLN